MCTRLPSSLFPPLSSVDVRMLKQDDIGQDGKWTGIVTEIRHYADPEEWKIIINWLNSSAWVEAVASQKALCIPGAGRRVRCVDLFSNITVMALGVLTVIAEPSSDRRSMSWAGYRPILSSIRTTARG